MEANKKSGTVTKIDVQQQVRSLLKITLGNAVMGFAYAKWMVPHQIINGGITSVSMLLDRLLGGGVATWTNGLTLVLLLCCAIFLGKENLGVRTKSWTSGMILNVLTKREAEG
ncbi:YitT family protein, partial [Lacticaseibacillus yichunensis]